MTDIQIKNLSEKINNADDDEALLLWKQSAVADINDAMRLHPKIVRRILKACKVPEETWFK